MTHVKSRLLRKTHLSIVWLGSVMLAVILLTSYFLLVPPLKERAVRNAQNINSKIMVQTDNMLQTIENFCNGITVSSDFNTAYDDYLSRRGSENALELLRIELNQTATMMPDVRNILLQTEDGTVINSITHVDNFDNDLIRSDWYRKLRSIDFSCGYSNVYQYNESGQNHSCAAFCKNVYVANTELTVVVFFNIDSLISITNSFSQNSFENYVWLDSERQPFYANSDSNWISLIREKFKTSNYITQVPYFTCYGGYNFMNTSSHSDWMLVSYLSEKSLISSYIPYFLTICLLMVLLFSVTLVLVNRAVYRIIKPVSELTMVMSEVSRGNLNVSSHINTNDEIGELSHIFNKMVADLREHIAKILEKEQLENKMKYSLLISQIDPHFIYNTMNTINYLARNDRTDDIIRVNTALIRILQDRLRISSIEVFDTLEQEISIIKQYVLIQRYRFESDFNMIYDIDQSLLECKIPKNIIQPLVENSMLHGLINEEDGKIHGTIRITAKSSGDNLFVTVSDDGRGIEPGVLKSLENGSMPENTRGRHIGVKNVQERLSFLYGNKDCIQFSSLPGEGTSVRLSFPLSE